MGRSLVCAASQEKRWRGRVARAGAAINALDERQQGKTHLPAEAAARQAAEAIMAQDRVASLVHVSVRTATPERVTRRDGTRPATRGRSERVRVRAASDDAAVAHAVRRLGWRVDATHHTAEALRLQPGVAPSRSASLIAPGCGRMTGRPVSLTPLVLHTAHRIVGLLSLLSVALRVLV